MGTNSERSGETERLNRVFDCLADEQRRRTLEFLCEKETPASIIEIAAHLAREGSDETTVGADCPRVQRCRRRLYHVHLPKLDAAELVDFDPETETVDPAIEVARLDELPAQPRS